ncbi:hypothetical protein G5V58_14530 [Nocardioides anomalus]|uniref:Uncharacterized protein n=1 Tax=Nocardioides anomalus TaxID=2712223 RepID=A0A6G6WF07_9ACTN|nr:hypothetical protein [Nocardioides anomalus]QIG43822.1 hypothetical protein G5V58_14530 [Nocardioides anomalus]
MIPLLVLGAVVLLALLYTGSRLLWAGRQLDSAAPAPAGTVAAKVDARLAAARSAVETLVMPEAVPADELRPSASAFRERAQTYVVLGCGLLGVAALLVTGVLLLL